MSIYRPRGTKLWHYDFQRGGRRFCGSTRVTNKADAKEVERQAKKAAETEVEAARDAKDAPATLGGAVLRYWDEWGQYQSNASDLRRDLGRIVDRIGKDKALADITDDDVTRLVAWRRGHRVSRRRKRARAPGAEDPLITPAQVNRSTTQALRRVFRRAIRKWKIVLPQEPDWSDHMLEEPRERVRELRSDEDEALADAMDPDYETLRRFSLVSGLRMRESLLQWSQVDFGAASITTTGKGGEPIHLPLTGPMREILMARRGHHPVWVFTYIAKRARQGRGRGLRYPITASGLKTHWRRRKARAGITDFRWHDNRHTFATALLRETGNLKLVQRGLNHRKIETTAKYAHVLDDELRAGMERAAERIGRARPAKKSRGKSRGAGV